MPPKFPCSDLPPELLDLIAKRLHTVTDIRNFRAVCRSWRSSTPLPLNLLSIVLPYNLKSPQDLPTGVRSYDPLAIIASNIYILQPLHSDSAEDQPKPWMIRVEENEPGKLQILEPLTHHKHIKLPESFPRNLNLSRVKVLQVFTGYNFNESYSWSRSDKLILYSSPQNSKSATKGMTSEALVLCQMGSLYQGDLPNEDWIPIRAGRVSKFDDVIRHIQGCNYAVDRRGKLYTFTCPWSVSCIVSHPICGYSSNEARKRLVEWLGEIYLVWRIGYVIRVYKLNEQRGGWDDVNDLGGKLLFVATDCCFFVDIENFPGWKENTVIFQKESFPSYRGNLYPNVSLFHPKSKGLKIGVYRWEAQSCCKLSSNLSESDTIWPPPTWFK